MTDRRQDRNGGTHAFNMRRRSWQVWFVLVTGTLICAGSIMAEALAANFDGVGAIVPVVFGGMCACVGAYTFQKKNEGAPWGGKGGGSA